MKLVNGKPTKVPINPTTGGGAMSNNPATWGTYEQAQQRAEQAGLNGVGFMLRPEAVSLVGVDIDDCIDDRGNVSEFAMKTVRELESYCEITPSGRGLRLFVLGDLPPGRRKHSESGFEIYNERRFLTVTGNHF